LAATNISGQTCTEYVYPNEDNLPAPAIIPVNFSVYNAEGDFSGSSVTVLLKNGNNEFAGTCTYDDVDTFNRDYECNVTMNYWYDAAYYDLNISFEKGEETASVEGEGECRYMEWLSSSASSGTVSFSAATLGVQNIPADDPLTIRNTGNVDFELFLKAYNLKGVTNPNEILYAVRFKVGSSFGTSVEMADAVKKNLSMSMPAEENAEDDIYFWMTFPATMELQSYTTDDAWVLSAEATS